MKTYNAKNMRSAFLLVCLLLAGVAGAAPKDTTVRVAIPASPSSINILQLKGGTDEIVITPLHQTLLGYDHKTGRRSFNDETCLTESVEILEDGKVIKIRMKKGQIFHTGDPVTAHDVRFTYHQVEDPVNQNVYGNVDTIEEVEVLGDYTVAFRFYEPTAAWKDYIGLAITSKKYFEKVGRKAFGKKPVGSGPFRFVERVVGEYILYEAFEDYPDGVPDFKWLKLIVVSDKLTQMALLETGELDLIWDVSPFGVDHLKRSKNIRIGSESATSGLIGIIAHPDTYPIMRDTKIGQAITHGIDRQEIINRVLLGQGHPLYMFSIPTELGHDPDYKIEFNPDKARRLLRESSYKPGTPFTLTYSSNGMVAEVIERYLKEIGLTVKLQQLEPGVHGTFSRNRDPREGHMSLFGWNGGKDPDLRLTMTLMSNSVYCQWCNRPRQKELDELVMAQKTEMNLEKRLALLKRIYAILREDYDATILYGPNMIYAINNRIDYKWRVGASGLFDLHLIKIVE